MGEKQTNTSADPHLDLVHISDSHFIVPTTSTYRSHDGDYTSKANVVETAKPRGPLEANQDMHHLFVHDDDQTVLQVIHYGEQKTFKPFWTPRAGPRAWIYFPPSTVKAAVVTCGGLCPGLNDVIRQVVYTLDIYGVQDILGIQYGFRGFVDKERPPIKLNRKYVNTVNIQGGSFLGVSRGTPNLSDIVDKLQEWNINMLFVIGGNGSHAAANAIYELCRIRSMKIVIVGVPKTIDNDILLVDRTFGFDTAVEEANRAIDAANAEASSAYNGIGIVKLMGRQSGYIAMYATLANGQVDAVLIPEVPFQLKGKHGVLHYIRKRLKKNGSCVIVVAEGAGQSNFKDTGNTDASGNPILHDVGKWLVAQVKQYFKANKTPVDVKYIDPTYMIRATTSNAADQILCTVLGQNAVHGAFAGYTNITVGLVNNEFCYLPIPHVIANPRKVDPTCDTYNHCVTSTGQPTFMPPPQPSLVDLKCCRSFSRLWRMKTSMEEPMLSDRKQRNCKKGSPRVGATKCPQKD